MTILAEIYDDPIFFASGPGFVDQTQSDPGFVNPIRSGPGFANPIPSAQPIFHPLNRLLNQTRKYRYFEGAF